MKPEATLPAARDKPLFTPGPLPTSLSVKQAMLHDAGSWHFEFNALVASVRARLLLLAGVSREAGWEAILMQGSGKVAVLANGAYGERMAQMLAHARIGHTVLHFGEDVPVDAAALEACLVSDS